MRKGEEKEPGKNEKKKIYYVNLDFIKLQEGNQGHSEEILNSRVDFKRYFIIHDH